MNFNNKILNDLLSKDFGLAKKSSQKLINDNILNAWEELTEKSEFIFDFIKEKINRNLASSINPSNFNNIFNFMKIYSPDFEDFILKSLLKFADEDLTDKLLELLESGNIAEKCWATLYFSKILDPLSLEFIRKNINTEDENLKFLTIKALKAHNDIDELNKAKENLKSTDDSTSYESFQFIITWQDKSSLDDLIKYIKISPYKVPLSLDIIYFMPLEEISKNAGIETSNYIFGLLIEGIPEIIKPDEYILNEISNYLDLISKEKNSENYALQLLGAKSKFELINSDDSYTFDLDKNCKTKIKEISDKINNIPEEKWLKLKNALEINLKSAKYLFETLEIIEEENLLKYSSQIAELANSTKDATIACKCCEILKKFNHLNLIDTQKILNSVNSENAKELIKSYFSKD